MTLDASLDKNQRRSYREFLNLDIFMVVLIFFNMIKG